MRGRGERRPRRIARIDLDAVVEDVDVDTLQAHLENITFGAIEADDLQLFSDEAFLKLFRLAQLTIEYLLNIQSTLYTNSGALEEQCKGLQEESRAALASIQNQQIAIANMKGEIRQKRRILTIKQNIGWLDVTMHNTLPMQMAQPAQHPMKYSRHL